MKTKTKIHLSKSVIGGCFLLLLASGLAACNEEDSSENSGDSQLNVNVSAGSGASVTPVEGTESATTTVLDDYDQSSFSKYVYWHKVENKILIDYNFFPEETDFDDTTDKVAFPCDFLNVDEGATDVNVNVNAGSSDECDRAELSVAQATFTIDGLVFDFSDSFTLFVSDFGFKITNAGFVQSDSGSSITVAKDTATLESVYNAILDTQ